MDMREILRKSAKVTKGARATHLDDAVGIDVRRLWVAVG